MELRLDGIIENYHSGTQIARVLTESWVSRNMYCPRCGNIHISHFEKNRPVADFFCPVCKSQFELKSKNGNFGKRIIDGAYDTMIERITSNSNPDFFFMNYSREESIVKNFVLIPKHFFVPDIIEKRSPLSAYARRAGWIGCNILVDNIPKQGLISIINDGIEVDKSIVLDRVNQSKRLVINDMQNRGWLLDVLNCVNRISSEVFTLNEVYEYEELLQIKHPYNNTVKAKIRQQMQLLRNKGFIEFLGNGKYRRLV